VFLNHTTRALATVLLPFLVSAAPAWGLTATEVAKLLPADGAEVDQFGGSVAVSGDTAVIGASYDDDNGVESGSAYVFTRDGAGVWTEVAKLLPADGAGLDWFGRSVAVSGDTAVIGALGDDDNGVISGSAYVFTRDGAGVWTEQAKLLAADGAEGDDFGVSVAVSGDTAVIGARRDDALGSNSGSAYVFTRDGAGVWTEQAKLLAADGADGNFFGWSVALSGDTAVIGAYGDDDNGYYSGSAYVFQLEGVAEPLADLGIFVTDDPDPVTRGSTVTYEVNVTNYGPDAAEGAILSAQFPSGVKVLEPIQASQGVCAFEPSAKRVDCDLGALPEGTTAGVWIEAIPRRPEDISLTATTEAAQPEDPNPDDNTATEYTTVERP